MTNDPWSKKLNPWNNTNPLSIGEAVFDPWAKPVMIEQPLIVINEQGKTTYETADNPVNDPWSQKSDSENMDGIWHIVNPPVGVDMTDEVKTTVIFEPRSEAGMKLIAIEEEKDGKHIVTGNHTHIDKRILVFECECGEELNPNTTRFAELCNVASDKDWVVEWSHAGYKPYCPKCALEQGKGND